MRAMPNSRRRRDERGQATIEMIGVIPIAVLIAGAIIQLFMIGYAAVAAESSARLAAREFSQGTDPSSAEAHARQDSPGIFDAQVNVQDGNQSRAGSEPAVGDSPVPDAVSAKAVYTVPFIGIGVKGLNLHVTRYVVVPRTN